MNKLNITWCWPDILNLHGDRGNVMALVRIAEKMGLEAEVHKVVNFGDEIDLDNTDILLLNPGEFKSCEYIVNAFFTDKRRFGRLHLPGRRDSCGGNHRCVFR